MKYSTGCNRCLSNETSCFTRCSKTNLSRVSVCGLLLCDFEALNEHAVAHAIRSRWCNDGYIMRLLSFIHFYVKHLFSLYAISHARQIYATRNSPRH